MAEIGTAAANELTLVELGDSRLNARAARIAEALGQSPSAGFPKVLSEPELEGYYRFVNNDKVTFEGLLEPHVEATARRAQQCGRVIVAHDTTDFRFSDEVAREGLGPMDNGGQGFYGHVSVVFDSARQPLGTIAFEAWTRTPKDPQTPKPTQKQRYESPEKESLRWMRAVRTADKELASTGVEVIHVMDREADSYDNLAAMLAEGRSFVIRASADRCLGGEQEGCMLKPFVRELEVRWEREAAIAHRKAKGRTKDIRTFPPRKRRVARLSFSAGSVVLRRPGRASKDLPAELQVNVVHVVELQPPEGCEPVEWFLLTDRPVDTEEQVLRVVDDYRTRWGIEEFFKALKTGCSFEKRQHESKHALLNALAIFLTLAWAILLLRHVSRDPQTSAMPATDVFSPRQIEVLRAKSGGKLALIPTVREAVLALARFFGGHLPKNGDPGWQVLGRAYESLLLVELGWQLAAQARAHPVGEM